MQSEFTKAHERTGLARRLPDGNIALYMTGRHVKVFTEEEKNERPMRALSLEEMQDLLQKAAEEAELHEEAEDASTYAKVAARVLTMVSTELAAREAEEALVPVHAVQT